MKKMILLSLAFCMSGCASVSYEDIELGKAEISNVEIVETYDLSQREHEFKVSFDYAISNFNEKSRLYYCSVLFDGVEEGYSMTVIKGTREPCIINNETGHLDFIWPSPIDRAFAGISAENFSDTKFPLEYKIVITQKLGRNKSKVIGKSDKYVSDMGLEALKSLSQ